MKYLLLIVFVFVQSSVALAQTANTSPSLQILAKRVDEDERKLLDWPELSRYREENKLVTPPNPGEARVVFMGDSITDVWGRGLDRGEFFPGKPYINRGISGQTTAQMLIRFRPDVVALRPRAVVILAGTNDIAGNTGPATQGMIEDNLVSMSELAKASGIKVILASVLPINNLYNPQESERRPPERIRELNEWLQAYARREGFIYLDYYGALTDESGRMKKELSNDGLHPNTRGYAIMAPIAQRAIDEALKLSK